MTKHSALVCAGLCLAVLGGCAAPEQIVRLPPADGSPSAVGRPSALVVQTRDGELVLDQPFAAASVSGGSIRPRSWSPEDVESRFRPVIEALPAIPRSFLVNFDLDSTQLTPESNPVLDVLLAQLMELPAPELIIIGHADDGGDPTYNERLSLERANRVLALIRAEGVELSSVSVVVRGQREPLVESQPGRSEPPNRRVEIRIK
jgi:outer membrane protein OmpA-like peptidoglycan-associated protein